MPGLRSLRNRLAVIFALIILGAIGTIYLSVTPRLQASLSAQRLDFVRKISVQRGPEVASLLPPSISADPKRAAAQLAKRDKRLRRFSETANTELLVSVNRKAGPFVTFDSTPDGGATQPDVVTITKEALAHRQASTIVETRNGRYALAAIKLTHSDDEQFDVPYVAIFSDSLADVEDNVSLIRRQVLLAGGIALTVLVALNLRPSEPGLA